MPDNYPLNDDQTLHVRYDPNFNNVTFWLYDLNRGGRKVGAIMGYCINDYLLWPDTDPAERFEVLIFSLQNTIAAAKVGQARAGY